jgi:hypothetical protein
MNTQDGLMTLFALCEHFDISLDFSYETGRYIPGEFIEDFQKDLDSVPPEHIRQGPKGWRVTVSGYSELGDVLGEEKLYSSLNEAIAMGLHILDDQILGGIFED